ncbi:hypothetical protein [Kocuria sp. U4B]
MPTPAQGTTPQTDLADLRAGDAVEAHQLHGPRIYRGEVETTAPAQGILWIRHGALQERKLLDAAEYHISRQSSSTPPTEPLAGQTPTSLA